jgi:hypothetical protein
MFGLNKAYPYGKQAQVQYINLESMNEIGKIMWHKVYTVVAPIFYVLLMFYFFLFSCFIRDACTAVWVAQHVCGYACTIIYKAYPYGKQAQVQYINLESMNEIGKIMWHKVYTVVAPSPPLPPWSSNEDELYFNHANFPM